MNFMGRIEHWAKVSIHCMNFARFAKLAISAKRQNLPFFVWKVCLKGKVNIFLSAQTTYILSNILRKTEAKP